MSARDTRRGDDGGSCERSAMTAATGRERELMVVWVVVVNGELRLLQRA
jgi:hypothetical protein